MSITNELRKWANGSTLSSWTLNKLIAIADRIDAEHEELMAEQFESLTVDMEPMTDENMAEHGWVRLPVDADGVPIRVGDVLTDGEYTFRVDELAAFGDGSWSICNEDGNAWAACDVTHYYAPTVEDVLREFAERYLDYEGVPSAGRRGIGEALMDEYAAKLRLAEGDDDE